MFEKKPVVFWLLALIMSIINLMVAEGCSVIAGPSGPEPTFSIDEAEGDVHCYSCKGAIISNCQGKIDCDDCEGAIVSNSRILWCGPDCLVEGCNACKNAVVSDVDDIRCGSSCEGATITRAERGVACSEHSACKDTVITDSAQVTCYVADACINAQFDSIGKCCVSRNDDELPIEMLY